MPKGKSWCNQFMLTSNSCEAIMMNWQLPWIDQGHDFSLRSMNWFASQIIDIYRLSIYATHSICALHSIYFCCTKIRYIPRCGMRMVPSTKSYWYEWYLPAQGGRGTVIPQLYSDRVSQAWQKIVVINKAWRTVEGPYTLPLKTTL